MHGASIGMHTNSTGAHAYLLLVPNRVILSGPNISVWVWTYSGSAMYAVTVGTLS